MNAFRDLKGGLHLIVMLTTSLSLYCPNILEPGMSRLGKTPETDLLYPTGHEGFSRRKQVLPKMPRSGDKHLKFITLYESPYQSYFVSANKGI